MINTIRWMIGTLSYYGIIFIGAGLYRTLLDAMPLWTWFVPKVIVSIVSSLIVGIGAYYIAMTIIYAKRYVLFYHIDRMMLPLKVLIGASFLISFVYLCIGKTSWTQFADMLIQFFSWCIVVLVSENTTLRFNKININALSGIK